jgi:threonine dehydratase
VSLASIREAATGLDGVAQRTPLVVAPPLADHTGQPVYLKLENRQPTGAFKLRGAWTAIRRLPAGERRRGIITYSSGNHGQAVAYAARRLGLRAIVVMPETAPRVKVDGVQRWGAEVVFAGTTSEHRYARAMELVHEHGFTVIPPFDHPDIIEGQGTVGLEIAEDLPGVRHVLVPVGGGGLVAGITAALAETVPDARVTAVEPEGARALGAALDAGKVVHLDRTESVADGLLPVAVGDLNFSVVRDRVRALTVSDAQIIEATVWLHRAMALTVEPSAAATTAALRANAFRPDGPTVLVVSGGNVDPDYVAGLEEKAR